MTQRRLFTVASEGPPIYIVDADVFMYLEGLNTEPDGSPRFSAVEATTIWKHLEDLMATGHTKVIRFVRDDLHRNKCSSALRRIARHKKSVAPRRTNELIL